MLYFKRSYTGERIIILLKIQFCNTLEKLINFTIKKNLILKLKP